MANPTETLTLEGFILMRSEAGMSQYEFFESQFAMTLYLIVEDNKIIDWQTEREYSDISYESMLKHWKHKSV